MPIQYRPSEHTSTRNRPRRITDPKCQQKSEAGTGAGAIEERSVPQWDRRDQRHLKVARSHAFPISNGEREDGGQISFYIRRGGPHTDCSDRSHPSHIGFAAGNRIHVRLCCYYRAIGVFVYWLTKSTDIESDNRHYSSPVRNPISPSLSPPSPPGLSGPPPSRPSCVYRRPRVRRIRQISWRARETRA